MCNASGAPAPQSARLLQYIKQGKIPINRLGQEEGVGSVAASSSGGLSGAGLAGGLKRPAFERLPPEVSKRVDVGHCDSTIFSNDHVHGHEQPGAGADLMSGGAGGVEQAIPMNMVENGMQSREHTQKCFPPKLSRGPF